MMQPLTCVDCGARVGSGRHNDECSIRPPDPAPEPVEVEADGLAATELVREVVRLSLGRTKQDRFQCVIDGITSLTADLSRALPVVEAAGAVVSEWEDSGMAFPRVKLAHLLDVLARAYRAAREQQMADRP